MKKFIITDIHGHYEEMLNALNDAGYHKNNPDHLLISLGDLFDRGPASDKVFKYVMSIKNKILIRGNHDLMLEGLYKSKSLVINDSYRKNGIYETVCQIEDDNNFVNAYYKFKSNSLIDEYFKILRWYYEDDSHIYVHSFLPFDDIDGVYSYNNFRENKNKNAWIDACWCNPFERYEHAIRNKIIPSKIVVFGHWSTSYAHCWYEGIGNEVANKNNVNECCFDIYSNKNIVALDSCVYLSKKVNVLVLED